MQESNQRPSFRLLVRVLNHWAIRDSGELGLGDTRKKSECFFAGVEPTTFLPITNSGALPLSYKRLWGAGTRRYSEKNLSAPLQESNQRPSFRLLVRVLNHWAIRDSGELGLGDTRKKSECFFAGVEPTTFLPITNSGALPLSYKRLWGAGTRRYSEKIWVLLCRSRTSDLPSDY